MAYVDPFLESCNLRVFTDEELDNLKSWSASKKIGFSTVSDEDKIALFETFLPYDFLIPVYYFDEELKKIIKEYCQIELYHSKTIKLTNHSNHKRFLASYSGSKFDELKQFKKHEYGTKYGFVYIISEQFPNGKFIHIKNIVPTAYRFSNFVAFEGK